MQKEIIVLAIISLMISSVVISDKCAASPTTAREVFAEVEAAAKDVADDAQLIFVSGGPVDTTGRGNNWSYVYESASLQQRFEIPVTDGRIGQSNTIDWLNADLLPIPEAWVDSNSAVAEAEANGGETFRQTYDDASIEMWLESEWANATEIRPVWHVRYISDASGEYFIYDVIAGEPTIPIFANRWSAQEPPVVENVRFEQRMDGTGLVDIYYNVNDADGELLEITIEASDDDGQTWILPCTSLTGDVGDGIAPGRDKHVVLDFYADNPDTSIDGILVRVNAIQIISDLIIRADLTLGEDLKCPAVSGNAIKIAAPNVTLDLGGHVLSYDANEGYDVNLPGEGILVNNFDGITIKNGTIKDFRAGIALIKSNSTTIENLTVRNLIIDDPNMGSKGIGVGESEGVVIRDCLFEFLPVVHAAPIITACSNVTIDNIEINGGFEGILFGGSGSITNSRFVGAGDAAVAFYAASDVLIADNIIIGCEMGISSEAIGYGKNRRLTIEGNEIHDGVLGIKFEGTIESSISNNIITNNASKGIMLMPNPGWIPVDECFYSTANVITDNVVWGSVIDLYHCEQCIGNTWERNSCVTKQGIEIPECTPITTTAWQALTAIDSVATDIAADAQLLIVFPGPCNATGTSYQWTYIYKSASQQSYYELSFLSGHIIEQESVSRPWMISEDQLPIMESWIDSNSAMAIAEANGGRTFRETYDDASIDMVLESEWANPSEIRPVWQISYQSSASEEGFHYHVIAGGKIPFENVLSTTARQVFTEVDAVALSIADDAQLIHVFGGPVDTTGRSSNWGYYYESASLQQRFEIPVTDGQVGQSNTIDWLNPDLLPIPEGWIDSNTAVAEAEENGGRNFRETHDDAHIEMGLESEWVNPTEIQPVWRISYLSFADGERFDYKVIAGEKTSYENVLSTTARQLITQAEATAKSTAEDAQLIFVTPMGPVDTTGRNNNWTYVYESASLQERYEFRVIDGEVEKQESFTLGWLVGPDQLPIPEEWMDSDSAVAVADENGGENFRQTHEDTFIEMTLQSEWATDTEIQPVWHVRYISNASGESFYYKVIAGPTVPFEDL